MRRGDELVGGGTRTPRIVLGKNSFTPLEHLALKHPAGKGSADRKGGGSGLNKGEPSGKIQVVLDDLGYGGSFTPSDAGEGDIQRVALADRDCGGLRCNHVGENEQRGKQDQGKQVTW